MNETMNLYEALRIMETEKTPFSITFDTFSAYADTGGERVTSDNVLYAGKKESEDYELIMFRSVVDDSVFNIHLFSLVAFNQFTLII